MNNNRTWHDSLKEEDKLAESVTFELPGSTRTELVKLPSTVQIVVSSAFRDKVTVVYNSQKEREKLENLRYNRNIRHTNTR